MNERNLVDLERLYHEVSRLESELEQISRDSGDWKTWSKEFKGVLDNILSNRKGLTNMIEEMNEALKKNNPNAPEDPSKPLSKEEKAEMAKKLRDLSTLFEGFEAMTQNAVETGALKPEEATMIIVDAMGRIMASLPDDNEYKKCFRHLKARLEMGDEIKSILDNSRKIRPAKVKADQVKAEGINISPEMLSNKGALWAGLLGAGAALAAPMVAQKVGDSGLGAKLATSLSDMLAQAVGGVEQTESVEEEEEVEVEAQVSEEVVIEI